MTAVTTDAVGGHRRRTARRQIGLAAILASVAGCYLVDIATGPAFLPLTDVVAALLRPGASGGPPVSGGLGRDTVDIIVWTIRLPMATLAVVVGAALGLAGAAMQTILGNPLASPYTLGISAAAGFGAALAIVLGIALPVAPELAIPANAFLFASLCCLAVFIIGRRRRMSPETLLLAGIALMFMFQSLLSLLQYLAAPEALQQIVFWLFGSLLKASWGKTAMVGGVIVVTLPMLLIDAWRLTAMKFGEERARALGVNVTVLRVRVFAIVSLLTATAVAFVGTIGFVGLVAPHIGRMLVGEDQRFYLPVAAAAGAVMLSSASIASKLLHPGAIVPIGIVTAIVGVPFLFVLILRQKRGFW